MQLLYITFLIAATLWCNGQPHLETVRHLVENRDFKKVISMPEVTRLHSKGPSENINKNEIELLNLLAYNYASLRMIDESYAIVKHLLSIKKILTKHQLTDLYFTMGYNEIEKSRFQDALRYLDYAQGLCLESHGEFSWQYARILLFTGFTYRQGFFNSDVALQKYEAALQVLKKSPHPYYEASIYYQMAIVHYQKRNYEKLDYYNFKALQFFETDPVKYASERAKFYNLSAIKMYFTSTVEVAVNEYQKGIDILNQFKVDQHLIGRFYDNMGVFYSRSDTAKAFQYFRKGLAVNKLYAHNEYWISNGLYNIGSHLISGNSFQYALPYLKNAYSSRVKLFGPSHPEIYTLYSHLAEYFIKNGQFDSAQYYFKQTFIGLNDYKPGGGFQLEYLGVYIEALVEWCNLLLKQSSSLKNSSLKHEAWNELLRADSIITTIKNSIDWEISKVNLSRDTRPLYNMMLEVAFRLQEENFNLSDHVLSIMEKARYNALLDKLKEANSYRSASNTLQQLKSDITEIQILINSTPLAVDRLRDLQRKFIELNDVLKEQAKQYVQSPDFLDAITTNPDENIIEIHESDSVYFIMHIAGESKKISRVSINKNLKRSIDQLIKICSTKPDLENMGVSRFDSLSNFLFNQLLQPFNIRFTKKLTIIPDGELSFLPFDVLITQISKNASFRSLQYLGKETVISTAFSVMVLHEQKQNAIGLSNSVIVFTADRKLKGSELEVQGIKKYFGVSEHHSKEMVFKNSNFNVILHFALHGHYDARDGYKSGIVFGNTDTLYAHQLYKLTNVAAFVAVNSCESGTGVYNPGEGIYSMARGFTHAGASLVLMNLWKIPDVPSAYLTENFYKYIDEGMELDASLQQAKLDYIKFQDDYLSHPYYWSSFTLVGDGQIKKEANNVMLYSLMASLGIALIILGRRYF